MDAAARDDALFAGDLEIRQGEGLCLARGRALALSVREFAVLAAMARHAGGIVSRQDLYLEVWGAPLRPGDRSVDVYVSKVRGKLEQAMPDRRYIHTHPGFGYRFSPEETAEGGATVPAPPRTARAIRERASGPPDATPSVQLR